MLKKIFRDRYSILSLLIILMIIIIANRLFSMQVANGAYYKNEAEKKLMRINTIKAPRGEIVDRFGKILANNRPGFAIEIVKANVNDNVINNSLQEIINILEKNNETYKDNLPIVLPFEFIFNSKAEEISWKNKYGIPKNASPKEAFGKLRDKYKIPATLNDENARKIITLRYEMSEQGYNSFKSVTLAFDVSQKTVSEIEEKHLEFPGVSIAVDPIRNYPDGDVASHIIGYIGNINQDELTKLSYLGYSYKDIIGKYGIEKTAEDKLKGINGKKFVETDLTGRFSKSLENEAPIQGGAVMLTIDESLQKVAEQSLKDTIMKIKTGGFGKTYADVSGGAAIAVDVKSGEILALANYPNFSPDAFSKGITLKDWNKLNKDPLRPLFNRAISGKYAPGSTFKMITGIGALQEGVTTSDERFLDTGVYKFYKDYQPACWLWRQSGGTHGYVNIVDAIKVSCNVYFYEMGRRLGIENIYKYASLFGLNSKTNIELDGEVTGAVASPEGRKKMHEMNKIAYPNGTWYPGDTLQAAIGQSDTLVTPIGMASYLSTLANGGTRYQLHIIKNEKSFDGSQIYIEKSAELLEKLSINKNNLDAIFSGMKGVASDTSGTAFNTFKDFPVEIGGKTGSAQTGITGQSANAWFVGFAPFDKPEIAVVVLIEHGGSGGNVAPVGKDIFSQYFGLNQVQQQTQDQTQNTAVDPNQTQLPPSEDEIKSLE